MEEKVITREDYEQLQTSEPKEELGMKFRIRLFPIWLRIIVVVLSVFVAFVIGSMIGYGVIAVGNPTGVLQKSTWTYIVDLVNKVN